MPTLSVDERERRIAADDGDADDIVLQVRNRGRQTCYHDPDADCSHVQRAADTTERTREWCHDHFVAPCKRCILGTAKAGRGDALIDRLRTGDIELDHEFEWDADEQAGGQA